MKCVKGISYSKKNSDHEDINIEYLSKKVTEIEIEPQEPGNFMIQILATIAACLALGGATAGSAWTSPALPYLKSEDSELPITESEGTWISSLMDLGAVFGHLLIPLYSNLMGRTYFLLVFTGFLAISWTLTTVANNVMTLYAARFIGGIGGSTCFSFSFMYIGEIADKKIRGILLLILKVSIGVASLLVKTTGAYLPYKMMNVTVLCMPILFFLIFPFMPESPYYLLVRNRKEEALETIKRLKGTSSKNIINSDLERIETSVKESLQNKKLAFRELFCVEENRKSLFVVLTAAYTSYSSGKLVIQAFTQEILSYSGFSLPAKDSTILLGVIIIIVTFISASVIEKAGRRKLFIISGLFSSIGLGIIGLFFFIKFYLHGDVTNITWLPLMGLIVYEIALHLGVSGVAYILNSEIFTLKVKITAMTFANLTSDIITFASKSLFQWLNNVAGIYTTFWTYAVCCLLGTTIFFFIAPETKGKTLEEIQEIFRKNTKNREKNQLENGTS